MVFRQLFDSDSSSYTYLLADEQTKAAVVIDPVKERVEELIAVLNELAFLLSWTLDTHVHADHVTGSGLLRKQTRAKIAVHHRVSKCADLPLHDGDHLSVGNIQIEIIETPGHTPDSDYQGNTHSTIGREKRQNCRAAGRTRAEFIDLMNNLNLPPPKRIDVTVSANLRCGLE